MNKLLDLAAKLPSGLPDPKALDKLHHEFREFEAATTRIERIEEAVDCLYYATKFIHLMASGVGLTVDKLMLCALAKYGLRARPGNPKDLTTERAAMIKILKEE